MSRLSELLKKVEKEVSRAGKKSGIRGLVSKNRRLLTGLAIGAGTGGLASLGFGGIGGAAGSIIGGAAGGTTGLLRDKRKRDAAAALADRVKQQTERGRAGLDLDKELEELIGEKPGETTGGEDQFPDDFQQDERLTSPGFGDGLRQPTSPSAPPQGAIEDLIGRAPIELNRPQGGLNLGESGAGRDEAKILAEAELARNLQEKAFLAKKQERATSLQDLSKLLTQRSERQFAENSPAILEDLNSRGLLRSSALGDRFAKERGRLESGVQEQLALQGLADRGVSLAESTGITDQFLGGRQSALQRRFSLEDFARQTSAAKLLGQATAPITPFQSGGKGGAGDFATAAGGVGSLAGAAKAGAPRPAGG